MSNITTYRLLKSLNLWKAFNIPKFINYVLMTSLDFAVEKAFKIGLYMSTLAILGAPTLAMMQTAFMTAQAITFQDAVVNEINIVYAGKLQSVNNHLLLPKNTTVQMFDNFRQAVANQITINVTTPLGSYQHTEPFANSDALEVDRVGGIVPTVSSQTQCYNMTTWRDQSYGNIDVTFSSTNCGGNPGS